jgi:transmembrane sensor
MFGLMDRRDRAAARWLARMSNEGAAFDREKFERWRAAHPGNALAFDEAAKTWKLDLPVWATRYAIERADISARGIETDRYPVRSRRGGYAAMAALLLAIGSGIGLERAGIFGGSGHTLPTQAANTISTGAQQVRAFRLSDGSLVALGAGSQLAIGFSKSIRSLTLLRGQARFDVAHDSTRPFEVRAGQGVVTAHGTVFDVRLTKQGARVSLLRGAIDIERIEGENRSGDIRKLAPGEALTVPAKGQLGAPELVDPAEMDNDTMFTFNDVPISEAVEAMNRRNARKIIVVGPRLQLETVSGGFRASDPDGFAQIIASMFDASISSDSGGNLRLTAKR